MSVVIRCRTADGRPAVLKTTPERARVAHEAAALGSWKHDSRSGRASLVDERVGALLIEAVEPGTPLAESAAYPSIESLVSLMTSYTVTGCLIRRIERSLTTSPTFSTRV